MYACPKRMLCIYLYLLFCPQDPQHRRPIHWASQGGHSALVTLLIDHATESGEQTPTEVIDVFGRTPLLMAAYGGFIDCLSILLEKARAVRQKLFFVKSRKFNRLPSGVESLPQRQRRHVRSALGDSTRTFGRRETSAREGRLRQQHRVETELGWCYLSCHSARYESRKGLLINLYFLSHLA